MTLSMVLDHLLIVLSSLVIAVGVGLPLGLIAYLSPKLGKIILRIVDLIQTTPALALLGIIMVVMSAGKPTVMVGLALYSLLPIVRNTYLGLSQVPSHLKEAGTGMGMSRAYRLFYVELPLALPMLFTGLRIAAVNAIGTAVFAASVGGGGIGSIINSGIRQRNMTLILAGTLALMAMALVLDAILAWFERQLNRHNHKKLPRWIKITGGGIAFAASCALVVVMLLPTNTQGQLVLYDGDYSEVKLMHSMVKQLVEDKTDLTVVIKDQMTQVNNFNELTGASPSCDMMFSYDGTVLTTFLGLDPADIPEGQSLYDFANEEVSRQKNLHLMGKVGLNNTYSIGVTQEVVDRFGITTISQLAQHAPELTLGGEHEFFTAEGSMKYRPFAQFYGLEFKNVVPVDVSLKYSAVESGAFDTMVVYATDGLNKRANLTILEDDRAFFPEYNGAFLIRNDLFQRFYTQAPNLEEVLDLLTGQVDNETMVSLTYAVDVEGKDIHQVAKEFLESRGFL